MNTSRLPAAIVPAEGRGIPQGSVTDAVTAHMHMDHVGGLLIDGDAFRWVPAAWGY